MPDQEQPKPTDSEKRINRVVNSGMQMIVSMASNGRAHRQGSGTVSDLKIGICVDAISSFRKLHAMAIHESKKTDNQDVKRGYFKIAHTALEGMVQTVEIMPDIDGTPPLPAPEQQPDVKQLKKKRQFGAAEPADQTQVPTRVTQINIYGKDRNSSKPVNGSATTVDDAE